MNVAEPRAGAVLEYAAHYRLLSFARLVASYVQNPASRWGRIDYESCELSAFTTRASIAHEGR